MIPLEAKIMGWLASHQGVSALILVLLAAVAVAASAGGRRARPLDHRARKHMLAFRLAHTAFIALAIVAAGVPSPAAAPFSPMLSGVVCLPDGRPAAHVTLQATADREDYAKGEYEGGVGGRELFVMRTDEQGQCQTQLASPDLPIRGDEVKFHGFLVCPDGAWWAPLQLQVTAQRPSVTLDVTLQRGDQVQGIVLAYPGGAPKPGAKVYAIMEDRLLRPAIV
jgi:hypothetical protein